MPATAKEPAKRGILFSSAQAQLSFASRLRQVSLLPTSRRDIAVIWVIHNPPIGGPERPIRTKSEDLLDRERFVRRLCDAAINRQTKLATGVTIGVTGEWGSGKSSILNLLHECIDEQYQNAIVIRFDPWLISGRDDLIRQFFTEFQASLKEKPGVRDKLSNLVDKLAEYSAYVAPVVNLKVPGAGDALSGGVNAINRAMSRETTLHTQRQQVMQALLDASTPIVVLIDELDRVEDAEIRAIAQLIRAVADFPSISYVLAYDHNRVIQALGAGENGIERTERGRAYLEKIVQFQIALPATLESELKALLQADLEKLATDVGLPDGWGTVKRFRRLLNIMVPHPIATPRDIKRLVGSFHVMGSMLRGEVEWVDLLGFCALLVKAPATVAKLRQRPDAVVTNPLSDRVSFERYSQGDLKPEERLARFLQEDEAESGAAGLLSFLFPWFARNESARDRHPDSLCFRRPLLTALRMGLPPGAFSRSEIETFLSYDPDRIENTLWELYARGSLATFLDRLEDIYVTTAHAAHLHLWLGVSRFLRRPDSLWPKAYSPIRDFTGAFGELFERVSAAQDGFRVEARSILLGLLSDGDVELSSYILIEQAFFHRLFGLEKGNGGVGITTAEEVETLACELAATLRDRHLRSDWAVDLRDPQPIVLIVHVGAWDQACKDKLESLLQKDEALDSFVLMLFGGHYMVGRDFIDRMVPISGFLDRINARVVSESLQEAHPSVHAALKKALNRS